MSARSLARININTSLHQRDDSLITIKRYPNRKLYNTDAKQYITLDGISDLIRQGEEVQILDHSSGEDLTTVTLTQIIFEQEKKQTGFLPRSVLTGLVQSGGQTLTSIRRTLASPLDLLRHVDQEITRRLQILVDHGDLSPEEGDRIGRLLLEVEQDSNSSWMPSDDDLMGLLRKRGVPTKDDIDMLNSQLDDLMNKIEGLTANEDET